jgi:hypothetical protein
MDSNLLDLAVGAPAVPYPDGPKALAATARDVALVLSPKGWTVGRDTAHSWLFTDAFGRKARLWRDSFDVWRLSAAPAFLPTAASVLAELACHAAHATLRDGARGGTRLVSH